jgi:hypothetical protein
MKVFDFTNGTKGDLLGDIKVANSTGGWLVEKNGGMFKKGLRPHSQQERKHEKTFTSFGLFGRTRSS